MKQNKHSTMNFTNQDAMQHIIQLQNIACELGHYGIIRVHGEDAKKFLQGQLTCDLDKVTDQKASLGGFCNVQGRLHGIFFTIKYGEDYLLLVPKQGLEHLLNKLKMYAVFFKVELVDASLDFQIWGHTQKGANSNFAEDMSLVVTEANGVTEVHLNSLFNASFMIAEKEHGNAIIKALEGTTLADVNAWDYIEIQAHIPLVYEETIEELLPHFVGLPQVGGVSFDKGCYTGQEIVARMHYRGKLKTHALLAYSKDTATLTPGDKVHNEDDKAVGDVIRSTVFDGKTYALISLADKAMESELTINGAQFEILD